MQFILFNTALSFLKGKIDYMRYENSGRLCCALRDWATARQLVEHLVNWLRIHQPFLRVLVFLDLRSRMKL